MFTTWVNNCPQGLSPTAKVIPSSTTRYKPAARAFMMHGVRCLEPMAHRIWEVERAFGGMGGGAIGVQWLLQWNRRLVR